MVRPGATTRKPRVNCLLAGWRTAFTVCQAMSMAITVVLPAPVASFRAMRNRSGLDMALAPARCSRNFLPAAPSLGATSDSQMAVSTASIWQKKGRTPWNGCWRQCCSRRAVSGVTCHCCGFGSARQVST